MLPLRLARHWRNASLILLLLLLAATMIPATWFWPAIARDFTWPDNIDKWAHAAAFAILTVWFAGQYGRQSYWRIAIGLLAYGFLIELCQGLAGHRSAEWLDIGANAIGIFVGLVIAMAGAGGWCQPFENWLIARRTGAGVD